MTNRMTRRNLHIPDPLWRRADEAARALSAEEGREISVAEYVRRALEEKLDREAGS